MKTFPIIIVSGPSCTGKTTLAKKISKQFGLPLVSKDGIKELLFDSLGWKDREWSKKLGLTSYDLLYHFMGAMMEARTSFIVESNFKAQFDTDLFLKLKAKYSFFPIQVQCRCDGQVLLERFKERSLSGERHPGHVDALNHEELAPTLLKGFFAPLEIGGEIIDIDTTDFGNIDEVSLFKIISSAIS